jgi:vesicular inhibitory amino acid transporter
MPMALGLISFCFGGHGAYPKIYVNMAERGKYGTVLVISGLIIVGIYAVVLCLGYYYYAQFTRLLITENIGLDYNNDSVSNGDALRVIAAIGIIFNLQFTCPLVTFPLRHMAAQVLNSIDCVKSSSCKHSYEKFLSFGIIAVATTIAVVLRNHLGAVITLIGSICTITNSIFLPIAFFHFLHPISLVSPFRYATHLLITGLAVIIVFIGVASSLCEISADTLKSVCSYFALTRQ